MKGVMQCLSDHDDPRDTTMLIPCLLQLPTIAYNYILLHTATDYYRPTTDLRPTTTDDDRRLPTTTDDD